jgi:actin-related protein
MKEQLCYIALNYEAEKVKFTSEEKDEESKQEKEKEGLYKLPDGNKISISSERFRAPELLFNPSLINSEADGVHKVLFDTINQCDVEVRSDLF